MERGTAPLGAEQAAGTACPGDAGFPQDPPHPPHLIPLSTSHPQGPEGTSGLKKEASAWVRMGEMPSPAALPHILSPARPAHGLGEPNPRRRKASWQARPAPNEPPQLCCAERPRQHPPAQRSEDGLPTLLGAGATLDQSGPPPRCLGPGRTRTPAAQPHFLVCCPPGIWLRRRFDVAAWQTAAGDRARITPCHCRPREGTGPLSHPCIGLPDESSQGLGADGPVSAGSPGAPVTPSSQAWVTGLVLSLAPGSCCSSAVGCVEQPRQRLWKRKSSRQRASELGPARRLAGAGGKPWLLPGLSAGRSEPSRGTRRPSAGTPVPKAEQCSLRDCRQPGASQSSARNCWQDTPEHAQDHKSSCYGAANQPAALQGEEGTFPGGKVISLLAPALSLTTTGAGQGPTGYRG